MNVFTKSSETYTKTPNYYDPTQNINHNVAGTVFFIGGWNLSVKKIDSMKIIINNQSDMHVSHGLRVVLNHMEKGPQMFYDFSIAGQMFLSIRKENKKSIRYKIVPQL